MSLVDNQEPQFAASTTMTSSSSTTTTTGKRKHGSDESIGASTTALTTAVADEAELTSHTSNASLTSMPLWVCAEILSFLDLASILNLTEVSVGVRAAFRTTVTAASIMANIVAQPCVNHRIDLSTDSGDTAWTKLRRAFNAWWCALYSKLIIAPLHVARLNSDASVLITCCTFIAAMADKRFTLENLHEQRCCRAVAAVSQASRRASVLAALGRLRLTMPKYDQGVQAFINATAPLSLHQCIAQIKCENHSRRTYASLDNLISQMTRDKFQHNQPWLDMADKAIRMHRMQGLSGHVGYASDWRTDGYDSNYYGQHEDAGMDDGPPFYMRYI